MASYKTTGIVLRRFNLGEADRIISFLTPDRGKLRAVAKGVRRSKSRLAGHLELFSQTELMLAEGKNLDIITSARLVRYYPVVAADYQRLIYAYLVTEMLDRLTEDSQPQADIYHMATECLLEIDGKGGDALLELYFKIRLLLGLGYGPSLSNCTVCGDSLIEGDYWFSPELGGIVDQACRRAGCEPMTARQIKLWRLALTGPLERLRRIDGGVAVADSSLAICERFYDFLFGRHFKSNQLLNNS